MLLATYGKQLIRHPFVETGLHGTYETYTLRILILKVKRMGIVKITDQLHEQLRLASAAMDRSINAQAEFWIKIGLLAELNPQLPYNELINKLLLDKPDLIRGRSQ